MIAPLHHEVVILGGGPAGSAIAIRLAQLGFNVALVERAVFPRAHVGISIADQTQALLAHLGISDAFGNVGFWRRRRTAVHWARDEIRFVQQDGYHVDRGVLDQMLLHQARTFGVHVYQPARVKGVRTIGGNGLTGQLTFAQHSAPLSCELLVDAAGRRPALPGTRIKDGQPLIALHSAWHLRQSVPYDGMITSGANGWAWYAQTGVNQAVVSIFVDPSDARSGGRDQLSATYAKLLAQFPALKNTLHEAKQGRIDACDAASTHAANPIGDRFIRVGDAAFSVDPLSSQGVHLALQSGLQAAIVVNTILRKPERAELAKCFYRERIRERVDQFFERSRAEYARGSEYFPSSFWHRRGMGGQFRASVPMKLRPDPMPNQNSCKFVISHDSEFARGPVIAGEFIEERMRLSHPKLNRPVAFIGGVEIASLLAHVHRSFGREDLPQLWSGKLEVEATIRVAHWLWQHGVIVEAA